MGRPKSVSRKKGWKLSRKDEIAALDSARELAAPKSRDLTQVVKKPDEKLTPAQQRALKRKQQIDELNKLDVKKSILPISKRNRVVLPPKHKRYATGVQPREEVLPTGVRPKTVDLWDDDDAKDPADLNEPEDEADDGFVAEGKEFFLKTTKIQKPKAPKTRKYVPSALQATKVADPGASYNPALDDYLDYANRIAKEEIQLQKGEERIRRKMKPEGVKFVTPEEEQRELEQGFFEESSDEEDVEMDDAAEDEKPAPKKVPKQKSLKLKKRALLRKIEELKKKEERDFSKQERVQFANLKKLLTDVDTQLRTSLSKAKSRAAQRFLDKISKRKRLGRGEFKQYEEPVLLTDELSGSLRRTKTHGGVLQEQMASLQERNIIPVAGPNDSRVLPKRLKRKFVERRNVREITAESKPI